MPRLLCPIALVMCAPLAPAQFQYAYDDGVANINVGPPSSFAQFPNTDLLWGNYFEADPTNAVLTSLEIGFGSFSSQPREVEILVYDDADDDFDPTDIASAPLFRTTILATDEPEPFARTLVDLGGPIAVEGGFFVAALVRGAAPGNEAAAALDPDASGDNSWLFYYGDADTDDLSFDIGFASEANNPAVFPFTGNWAIRANAVPGPAGAAALAFGGVALLRRRR
ncbi:MAG: hypothetical protein AAGH64_10410 [Planctomycetota bacterium]